MPGSVQAVCGIMSVYLVDSYNHSNTIIMHHKSHFDKNLFLVAHETYKKNHLRGSIKQHSISHVLYWTIIYLHQGASQIVSFHYCKFPYQNLGFSLMGFITFHSYISIRLVSLTLLQAPSVDRSLGLLPAVSRNCPSLSFHLA